MIDFIFVALWIGLGFAVGFACGHEASPSAPMPIHSPRLELYLSCLKSLKENPGVSFDCNQFLSTPEMNWAGPALNRP